MFIDNETRAIVQGITGRVGRKQTRWMVEAGDLLVGGVTPGRDGQAVHGLPVYATVVQAVEAQAANTSVIFVPPPFVRNAVFEAIDAGLKKIIIVTEFVPIRDTMEINHRAQIARVRVLGPNCPGVYRPGLGKLGIMPASIFQKGNIGIVGRSATLSYEVIANLSAANLGQRLAVGVGGDPVVCTEFIDVLHWFENDPDTQAVVMVGEIGGTSEQRAAALIQKMTKPVVALIAGRAAPKGKRFGHAGAIVQTDQGGADQKRDVLQSCGAVIADTPAEIPGKIQRALAGNTR